MIRPLIAALTLAASPALAMDAWAPAVPCPDGMELDSIVEPWADNTASYSEGAVRIALIDLIEPAAAAFQLAVLHPPRDLMGARQCHLVAPGPLSGLCRHPVRRTHGPLRSGNGADDHPAGAYRHRHRHRCGLGADRHQDRPADRRGSLAGGRLMQAQATRRGFFFGQIPMILPGRSGA